MRWFKALTPRADRDSPEVEVRRRLSEIDQLFGSYRKPQEFVSPDHCEECREHNETLLKHTVKSISLAELGTPTWDPICFTSMEGLRYYMPALARLSLGSGDEYYLSSFISHLSPKTRLNSFTLEEREVLSRFLESLWALRAEEIESSSDSDRLAKLIGRLKNQKPA